MRHFIFSIGQILCPQHHLHWWDWLPLFPERIRFRARGITTSQVWTSHADGWNQLPVCVPLPSSFCYQIVLISHVTRILFYHSYDHGHILVKSSRTGSMTPLFPNVQKPMWGSWIGFQEYRGEFDWKYGLPVRLFILNCPLTKMSGHLTTWNFEFKVPQSFVRYWGIGSVKLMVCCVFLVMKEMLQATQFFNATNCPPKGRSSGMTKGSLAILSGWTWVPE